MMMRDATQRALPTRLHQMAAGMSVEVRSSFDGGWCPGFEVVEVVVGAWGVEGYRLRRMSDGSVLPVVFPAEDLIPSGR